MLVKPICLILIPLFWCAPGFAQGPKASPAPAPSSSSSPSPKAFSLEDAYASALKHSEDVAVQKEILTQVQELETQSQAGFLPNLQGTLPLYTDNDRWGNSTATGPSNYGKLTLNQPLFQGFRTLALLNQRKALTAAQKFQIELVKRQLLTDVTNAYYTVLSNQSDEVNYQNEIEANNRRLKELREFLKIGKSQESDLLTFQSNVSTLEAQLENTRGQLEISKQNLAYLTGWDSSVILTEAASTLPSSPDVAFFLQKLNDRPDVLAAKAQVSAAKEGIDLASGQHWPSVDLQANYNFQRPGDAPGGSTDAQVLLTLPLFQGGSIRSQVRQAKALSQERELELTKILRSAETQVKTLYASFISSKMQIEKYEKAVDFSKRNYEIMGRNYRRGNVTNLEVLQALTTYQASQRTLERQKISTQMNYANLQVASGNLPAPLGAQE
jgi:outer membrane protein